MTDSVYDLIMAQSPTFYLPLVRPASALIDVASDIPMVPVISGVFGAGPKTFNALEFVSANTEYLRSSAAVNVNDLVDGNGKITLLGFVYPTGNGQIISLPASTVSALGGMFISRDTGNFVAGGRSATGDTFQQATGAALSLNTWQFVAAVFDFTNGRIGVRVGINDYAYTNVTWTQTTYTVTVNARLGIGVIMGGASPNDYWGGRLAHLAIVPAEVTNADLNAIENAALDAHRQYLEQGANTASLTLTGFPASASGIAVDVSVDRDSAPFYSATGQSANGSGELAIAATGCPLATGTRTAWIRCTNSDGLAGGLSNNSRAFYSPVEVTVS